MPDSDLGSVVHGSPHSKEFLTLYSSDGSSADCCREGTALSKIRYETHISAIRDLQSDLICGCTAT